MSNYAVLSGLKNRGHNVTVCYELRGDYLDRYIKLGFKTVEIDTTFLKWKSPFVLWNVMRFARNVGRVAKAVMLRRNQVIYCNVIQATPLAAACASLMRCPLVVHVRVILSDTLSRQFLSALRRADLVIANSNECETQVKALLPEAKTVTVYNGIDSAQFQTLIDDTEGRQGLRLLFIGRVVPVKGLHVLLDALEYLGPDATQVSLDVCGETPSHYADYARDLEQRAKTLVSTIRFHGHCDDVPAQIARADAVVVPSIWQEAFGRVLVEAMAGGKPAIASVSGGMPEVLGADFSRYLFEKGNSHALAQVIRLVWHEQQDGLIPKDGLRRRAEQFSVERMVDAVEANLTSMTEKVSRDRRHACN